MFIGLIWLKVYLYGGSCEYGNDPSVLYVVGNLLTSCATVRF
jgi:hypothetical protein